MSEPSPTATRAYSLHACVAEDFAQEWTRMERAGLPRVGWFDVALCALQQQHAPADYEIRRANEAWREHQRSG